MAVRHFRIAVAQGDALGYENLGFCYSQGLGDNYLFFSFILSPLDLCFDDIKYFVINRKGTVKKPALSVKYYKLALPQADGYASQKLAYCHSVGQGTPVNDLLVLFFAVFYSFFILFSSLRLLSL